MFLKWSIQRNLNWGLTNYIIFFFFSGKRDTALLLVVATVTSNFEELQEMAMEGKAPRDDFPEV